MHDAITGEKLGIPSVGIMTTQFISAAELMSRVLGMDGYRFLAIEHPISSASTEALQQRAKLAAAEARDILLGSA